MSIEISSYLVKKVKIKLEDGSSFFEVVCDKSNKSIKLLNMLTLINEKIASFTKEEQEKMKLSLDNDPVELLSKSDYRYVFIPIISKLFANSFIVDWNGVLVDGEEVSYNADYMETLLTNNFSLFFDFFSKFFNDEVDEENVVNMDRVKKT